jgi:hypothetical protein
VLAGLVRWPRPRSRRPLTRLLRGLWTLPTNAVGHAAGWLVSGRAPRPVGGPAGSGWLYPIRRGLGLDWVGAVTLGNAILYSPGMLDRPGDLHCRLTLAHELAHTRQHDRLGPLYLPLHIIAQSISAAISFATRRRPAVSRVHDWNPLEQTFICLPASATRQPFPASMDVEGYLAAFGA